MFLIILMARLCFLMIKLIRNLERFLILLIGIDIISIPIFVQVILIGIVKMKMMTCLYLNFFQLIKDFLLIKKVEELINMDGLKKILKLHPNQLVHKVL